MELRNYVTSGFAAKVGKKVGICKGVGGKVVV